MQTQSRGPRPAAWVVAVRGVSTSSILVVLVAALGILGTVMVGSASEVVSIATYGSPWSILIRQCMWLALGGLAMFFVARADYRVWRRISRALLVVAFAGLLLVLVPHLGLKVTGSTRWLGFGSFDVQPSEVMKLALAVFGADLIARREDAGRAERTIIGPMLLVTAAAAGLILLQPDMGTAVVVVVIVLGLLVASGLSLRPIAKAGMAVAVIGSIAALADPYRRQRLLAAFDPGAHAAGSGYQVTQSLIGLGSGGALGVGLGDSAQKWGYLPNAHTDFIFSVIGDELGMVGAVAVLVLLGGVCWFGLRAALRAPDRFGSLLGVGIVAWIAAETVINVGAVIGVLPVTGIPLPFISYGGSSLVVTMAGAGLLVSIARRERQPGSARPARMRHAERVGDTRFAVVSGGGTGGHVLQALAVARALEARGHPRSSIELFGSRRGQEASLLGGEGFPMTLLPGRGIARRLDRHSLAANVEAVTGLAWASVRALAGLHRRRPRVVVSVGGYASFPADLAAVVLRIPLVLVNIDAVPGLVHRVLARRSVAAAVAFPGTPLPRAVVTGTAVRQEIRAVTRDPDDARAARADLGIPTDRFTVGVVGGSLGARRINRAVIGLARLWASRADRTIYQVTGARDFAEVDAEVGGIPAGEGLVWRRVAFERDMATLYRAVDVLVCRAGAVTVAELTVTGTPSVLVPLPGAPGDHQTANARALADAGAGLLVPDDTCDGPRLAGLLDELAGDPARRAAMGRAAHDLGRPDAADRVAELVDAHAS